ncbi:hypothetical protein RFI_33654 [Reticulomyxa filosa]|uniref:Alcohol dehydrogenase-like N-terminal domain-containing protein n=1 Tax=Reticulomyxa filosa TaxID=46433 RepID=X6LPA1_RETFI|nr:hypothetical protein RFI_33654 [Reticulomyxa filosa]|eukprot:ETO03748.1 hypothetical protein RFI_33654 [Reticulomyxa filosa]
MKQWSCTACFCKKKKIGIEVSKTMKGLIKASTTEGYEYKEMNVPEPREGELLIQSFSVGISAIDIDLFKGRSNLVAADQIAFVPGHEVVGMVVKKGKQSNTHKK